MTQHSQNDNIHTFKLPPPYTLLQEQQLVQHIIFKFVVITEYRIITSTSAPVLTDLLLQNIQTHYGWLVFVLILLKDIKPCLSNSDINMFTIYLTVFEEERATLNRLQSHYKSTIKHKPSI